MSAPSRERCERPPSGPAFLVCVAKIGLRAETAVLVLLAKLHERGRQGAA